MKIFLNGFMASGKTTIGKKLANYLKLEFIDLDDYIENKFGCTIRYIFEMEGEDKFREKEREALLEVIDKKQDLVISTGGGAPCFFDNMDIMNNNGVTFYLELDIESLTDRLEKAKDYRPLIWGKSRKDLKTYIIETLEKRKSFYTKAKHTVDAKDIKVEKILEVLKEHSIG